MRTTLNLPDALAEEVRRRATEEGRTFTSLGVEGLRAVLARTEDNAQPVRRLPTSGRPGDQMLVDITDRDAIGDVLDADGPR